MEDSKQGKNEHSSVNFGDKHENSHKLPTSEIPPPPPPPKKEG